MTELTPSEKIAIAVMEAHRKRQTIEFRKYSYGYWYQMGFWDCNKASIEPQHPKIKPYMEGWESAEWEDYSLSLDNPDPIDIGDYL